MTVAMSHRREGTLTCSVDIETDVDRPECPYVLCVPSFLPPVAQCTRRRCSGTVRAVHLSAVDYATRRGEIISANPLISFLLVCVKCHKRRAEILVRDRKKINIVFRWMFDGCCVMLCFVRIHKTSPRTDGDAQPSFCQFSPTEPRRCVTLCECILLVVMSVSDIKLCERTQSKLFLLRTRSQDGKRKTSGCPGREHAMFRKAQSGFESSLAPFAAWHRPAVSLQLFECQFISLCTQRKKNMTIKDFI